MLSFNSKVWFYRKPVDFRKQLDSLIILVADLLKMAPSSGQLFVFRNKGADKIKMIYFADNGFWLLYRRNEDYRFKYPSIMDEYMELSAQELQWLLSGIDITLQKRPKKITASNFF